MDPGTRGNVSFLLVVIYYIHEIKIVFTKNKQVWWLFFFVTINSRFLILKLSIDRTL